MPKQIEIQSSTFERLQQHAIPLLDTPDAVINRALDALEHREEFVTTTGVEHKIDPRSLPDLTHTKILNASLEGKHITRVNWNRLVGRILILAMKQFEDFDQLRKNCLVNVVQGCKTDKGFHYLAEIDVSIQGMRANDACEMLVKTAQLFGFELEVIFMWRPKEGAAHPGGQACLKVSSFR